MPGEQQSDSILRIDPDRRTYFLKDSGFSPRCTLPEALDQRQMLQWYTLGLRLLFFGAFRAFAAPQSGGFSRI
jgi:hypothetical protein